MRQRQRKRRASASGAGAPQVAGGSDPYDGRRRAGPVDKFQTWMSTTPTGLVLKAPCIGLLLTLAVVRRCFEVLCIELPRLVFRCRTRPAPTTGAYHVREGVVRTPMERFEGIPFHRTYPPQFFEHAGLRVAFVDTGVGGTRGSTGGSGAGLGVAGGSGDDNSSDCDDASRGSPPPTLLMLHGEPDWGVLYAEMVETFDAAGYRCVVPDFVGFGRSDKLTDASAYNVALHEGMVAALLDHLDLRNVTVICQDWGGLTALAMLSRIEDRVARLVIMNTGISPMGAKKLTAVTAFWMWRLLAVSVFKAQLPVGLLMTMFSVPSMHLTPDQVRAYDAPYPTWASKAGVVAWPSLVPFRLPGPLAIMGCFFDHQRMPTRHFADAVEYLRTWDKPTFVCFSDRDMIFHGDEERWLVDNVQALQGVRDTLRESGGDPSNVPFAAPVSRGNGSIVTIPDAGHFLQHDQGLIVAAQILRFMADHPSTR